MNEATQSDRRYLAFWLYKLDPSFYQLSQREQETGKQGFAEALDNRPESVTLRGLYSFAGLRSDTDLMLWTIGPDLDDIRGYAVGLRQTSLGRRLNQVQTYVGVTTAPRYDPEHQPAFAFGTAPKKYASVYPFVKTSDWYLLSREERGKLMTEHGQVGRKYAVPRERLIAAARAASALSSPASADTAVAEPITENEGGVLSNTVDAFGLGDYEFILANESDDPSEIVAMMMALRSTEVRRYTKLDTPIYFGRLRTPTEALAEL